MISFKTIIFINLVKFFTIVLYNFGLYFYQYLVDFSGIKMTCSNKNVLLTKNINSEMVLIRKEELKFLYKKIKTYEEKIKKCQCNQTDFLYSLKNISYK